MAELEAERGAEALSPWEVLGHSMCLPPDGMDLLRDALEETRLSVVPAASVSAPQGLREQKLRDALVRAEAAIARRDAEIDRLSALPDSERPDKEAKLIAAIRDIDRAATSHDDAGEGWITRYTMPVGPLHRALGLISGEPDPSAQETCICGPGPSEVNDHCRYARHGEHTIVPQRGCDQCWDDLIAGRIEDQPIEETHVTHLFKAGDLWGWGCTCRASDGTHETRKLAAADAQRHADQPTEERATRGFGPNGERITVTYEDQPTEAPAPWSIAGELYDEPYEDDGDQPTEEPT